MLLSNVFPSDYLYFVQLKITSAHDTKSRFNSIGLLLVKEQSSVGGDIISCRTVAYDRFADFIEQNSLFIFPIHKLNMSPRWERQIAATQ